MQTELLAQMVEVTSVLAADKRLRKPVHIPRPAHLSSKARSTSPDAAIKKAVGVFAATRRGSY